MLSKPLTCALTVFVGVAALQAAPDWPQWQGPIARASRRRPGCSRNGPPADRALVWTANGLGSGFGSMAVAGNRVFVQGARGSSSVVMALNRADGKESGRSALGEPQTNDRGPGPRGTPTVDGDRLYVLTENGDLACLKTDGAVGLAAQHPQGIRRLAAAMADQRVAAGRRTASRRLPRRTRRRHGEARQDDRQDGLDGQGAQRFRGLLLDHRGRRPGRAHLHDLHGAPGVGVRASDGKLMFRYPTAANRRREHRHADLLEQQGLLHVGLRHRRRAAGSDGSERRGRGEGGRTSRAR